MNAIQKLLCLAIFVSLAPAAPAQDNLPQPDPEFRGKIATYAKDSSADGDLFKAEAAPDGAPNILLVLLDDVGFGAPSTFGGPCQTPVLDRLASTGLRYNRFHTTALCSPTRASLLTGHNHHSVATGVIIELGTGFPGYTGKIPRSTATIGQLLQNNGYSTAWFGKNHNVPDADTSMVGPFGRWPNGLGFDYFYGFIGGETDQWYPTIYENQNPVQAWGTPDEGYNFGIDMTDKAIAWMRLQNSIAPDRPFFLYYAPGATHAPHHPPQRWVEKYQGKFAHGWDRQREIAFERQKQLGVIPAHAKLTPRPAQMPAWDSFDAEAKKLFERQMETYAAYLEFTDHQVGRVIDAIEQSGELDNTLIIYISGDNGASAEGGFNGTANEMLNLNGVNPTVQQNMKFYDKWGGPETSPHFAVSWAWAMDSPFRWTKQVASHFGGTRNPMVISWPKRIKDAGGLREQFLHVNDIAPTVLEVLGIPQPKKFNGIAQKPMEGISLAYTFDAAGATAKGRKTTQYFELFGNRGIYHEGWMAATFHKVPWDLGATVSFENDQWELFNLEEDFTQATDLSQRRPEKLKQLQDRFLVEAKKYDVLPLDDRGSERFDVTLRPSFTSGREKFVFYPGATRLAEGVAPNFKGRSHTITAEVEIPEGGAEGVLLAMGGGTSGFVLYVKDGKFIYDYDWFSFERYSVQSEATLPTGKVRLAASFQFDGQAPGSGGTVVLSVNGEKAGEGRVEQTVAFRYGMDSMDVGMDLQAPVSLSYKPPFKFTGTIDSVMIELK